MFFAFSRELILENKHSREVTYFVYKTESFVPPIRQVMVDDKIYPYERSEIS